ncbi:hypothetical protein ACFSX5_19020, partial [Devosia albogilva]
MTGLLLLVFSAFAVLGTAHASSSTHATHQDQAVASAQQDAYSHSDDRSEVCGRTMLSPEAAPDRDCGTGLHLSCLLPDPLPALPTLDGEPPSHSAQRLGRNPSGILRPPRLDVDCIVKHGRSLSFPAAPATDNQTKPET